MDRKVDWSPEAVEDLESIADYISKDSEFYASSVVMKVLESAGTIGKSPLIGRVVPELDDESIRERFIFSYRLIYRIAQERILIIAVVHGKRLLESISERFSQS
jgi:toxin ParE1/3/4